MDSQATERWLRRRATACAGWRRSKADWWRPRSSFRCSGRGRRPGRHRPCQPRPSVGISMSGTRRRSRPFSTRMRRGTWMGNIMAGIEAGMTEAGLDTKQDWLLATRFFDITGHIRSDPGSQGDDVAAALVIHVLADGGADLIRSTRGKAIKWLGDGVMLLLCRSRPGSWQHWKCSRARPMPGFAVADVGPPTPRRAGAVPGGGLLRPRDEATWAARIADYAPPRRGRLVPQAVVDAAADVPPFIHGDWSSGVEGRV